MTEEELKNLYKSVDPLVLSGKLPAGDLIDEQVAGLWLCKYETAEKTLSVLRTMPQGKMKKLVKKWPRFKGLIEAAWRRKVAEAKEKSAG
jgi:hypothetical protein